MLPETRDALLYSQLQEGLRDSLMEGPAVSGAADYQALCIAAKNEERRQVELKKRKQYRRPALLSRSSNKDDNGQAEAHNTRDTEPGTTEPGTESATTVRRLATWPGTALRKGVKVLAR